MCGTQYTSNALELNRAPTDKILNQLKLGRCTSSGANTSQLQIKATRLHNPQNPVENHKENEAYNGSYNKDLERVA
jgi:hypothetical protein